MRIRSYLKIAAVLGAGFAVSLIAVAKSIDVNHYRGWIAGQVKVATGRDMAIKGDITLKLSLSLSPSVVAQDVTFANARGGSRADMVSVKRIEAEIDLLPLLASQVRINRLALVEPNILIETDAKGRGNWEFGPAGAAPAADHSAPSFNISEIRVLRAAIVLRDGAAGTERQASIDKLTVDAKGLTSPLGIAATGEFDGTRYELSGVLGSPNELQTQTKPFPVNLKLEAGGVVAVADGTVEDLAGGLGLDLKVSAEGPELADAVRLAGAEIPLVGPFRLSARLTNPKDVLRVSDLDAAVGRRDLALVTVKGTLARLVPARGLDVMVTGESENLAALSPLLGAAIPALGPAHVAAHVTEADGVYKLAEMTLGLGHSDASGEASVDMRGPRPAIKARLASESFDTADLSPASRVGEPGHNGDVAEAAKAAARESEGDGRVFSDEPLPIEALAAVDVDLDWTAERVVMAGTPAEKMQARIVLKGGKLSVKPMHAGLAGGRITADLDLDGTAALPVLTVTVRGDDVDLGRLLRESDITDTMAGGKTSVAMTLRGRGRSVREMMAKLDGTTLVMSDAAVLADAHADLLALDFMRQIAPWTESTRDTRMECLVGRFTIAGGIARSDSLLFDTSNMTLSGRGTVNLATERLDMTLLPSPKVPSLLSLATAVDVGGTLAAPSMTPNAASVAKTVVGAVAGAALGPVGLLVPLVNIGSVGSNACIESLKAARG